jgi:Zn-dependent metalloprotease
MLRSMYSNTSGTSRQNALASIVGSARMRGRRQAGLALPTPGTETGEGRKFRRVFTAQDSASLPGTLVMQEGDQPSTDTAVNEAYDGAGLTYDLFWQAYHRDSLDGNGLGLDSTVHYQQRYENAFWDGRQMVYGDGDRELFNRFTLAVDVIGHELSHGVMQYTSNLNYRGESGALSESFSDVFGSMVKQRQRRQTAAAADWLVGEGIFTSRVGGVALRSLKEPGTAYDDPTLGKDPQPAHMRDFVVTLEDSGGVHINSGIPNHAFFLTAVALGGYAWERAGRIWYLAVRDRFKADTDFKSAADLTHQVAEELYGVDSPEAEAVRYGWQGVGITIGGRAQPRPSPDGCSLAPIAALRSLVKRRRPGGDSRVTSIA